MSEYTILTDVLILHIRTYALFLFNHHDHHRRDVNSLCRDFDVDIMIRNEIFNVEILTFRAFRQSILKTISFLRFTILIVDSSLKEIKDQNTYRSLCDRI